MKTEKFSESLTNIEDKYIEEAAAGYVAPETQPVGISPAAGIPLPPKKDPSSKGLKVWRIIAIAACAVLVAGIAVAAIGLISDRKSDYYSGATAAAGGGSYMAEGEYYVAADEMPYATAEESAAYDSGGEAEKNGVAGGSLIVPTPSASNENAKIIYTARLSVETTNFDESQAKISEATERHHGYFESMDFNNTSSSYRSAYYQIRIPSEELDAFLNESSEFGNVISAGRNAEDVSESYYDTEARLESAKAKLQRLEELYAQAQNMSDIITIESEISNVQWEIDSLSGSLKHYDSQVDYSTVSINLNEVYKLTEEVAPLTFSQRISQAFEDGLGGFADAMEDLLIWLAGSWLWILLVIIVIGAAIIIAVKVGNKDSKKAPKK